MDEFRTIAAICTPIGTGGIGVIRISGGQAFEIADRIFEAANGKPVSEMKPNTIAFGRVVDRAQKKTVDEVLVSKFQKPHSFTGEDTVEISCHGGVLLTKMILELSLKNGASLAQPGEFSKRAFLNGKMDLSKAEAVIEMISAKAEDQVYNNALLLGGRFQSEVSQYRQQLIDLTASILAKVEYPDEDIDDVFSDHVLEQLKEVSGALQKLADSYRTGKILSQGISAVIVGRPNVGKSSLLNRLLKENRAIVTDVEGTTRDVISEYATIRGILFRFLDTAGMRETEDQVEKIGVEKAAKALEEADLVLFVRDAAQRDMPEDAEILQKIRQKPVLTVWNKADCLDAPFSTAPAREVLLSAKTGDGLDALQDALVSFAQYPQEEIGVRPMITSVRQKESLEHTLSDLRRARASIEQGIALDLATIDLQQAISDLGEVTGKTVSEEIIDTIFSRFCLGK